MSKPITESQARKYLAEVLIDAITEAEVPIGYLTGDESNSSGGTRPDRRFAKKLAEHLRAVGAVEAAVRVETECGL